MSTLVDAARSAARFAPAGQPEREVANARGAEPADFHRVEGFVGAPHLAPAARIKEPFGVLAHQHQIDLRCTRAQQRHGQTGEGADGPHASVQVEREPDVKLRDDLGSVGLAHMRQAHRAEQDRVGVVARFEGAFRQSDAGIQIVLGAGRVEPGRELSVDERRQRVQYGDTGARDFGADAVAREDGDGVDLRVHAAWIRSHVLQPKPLEDGEQFVACPLAMVTIDLDGTLDIASLKQADQLHVFARRIGRLGTQAQGEHAGAMGTVPVVENGLLKLAVSGKFDQLPVETLVGGGPGIEVVDLQGPVHQPGRLDQRLQLGRARLAPAEDLDRGALQRRQDLVNLTHVGRRDRQHTNATARDHFDQAFVL